MARQFASLGPRQLRNPWDGLGNKISSAALVLWAVSGLHADSARAGGDPVNGTSSPQGAPAARAGEDRQVSPGEVVRLDASASTPARGGTLSFLWFQVSGPPVELFSSSSAIAQFVAPSPGASPMTLEFAVRVSEDRTAAVDSIRLTVVPGRDFQLAVVDPYTRVSKDNGGPPSFVQYSELTPSHSATVYAAGGETTSLQLVVYNTGTVPSPDVDVYVEPSGDAGADIAIEICREHFVRIAEVSWLANVNNTNPLHRSEGLGYYPDALIPFEGPDGSSLHDAPPLSGSGTIYRAIKTIPIGQSQPYWIDVSVPPGLPPCTYTRSIVVTSGSLSRTLDLNIVVWPFDLPESPSEVIYLGSPSLVQDLYGMNAEQFAPARAQIDDMYWRHRVIPAVGPGFSRQLYRVFRYDYVTNLPVFNSPAEIVAFKERYVTPFHLPYMVCPIRPSYMNFYGPFEGTPWPNFYGANGVAARAFVQTLDQILYDYDLPPALTIFDEPGTGDAYRAIDETGALLRQAVVHGKVKLMVLKHPFIVDPSWPDINDDADLWTIDNKGFSSEFAQARRNAGAVTWGYNALAEPRPGCAFWNTDLPLLNYRLFSWSNWLGGNTGMYYWESQHWSNPTAATDYEFVWTRGTTYRIPSPYIHYNGYGSLTYDARLVGFHGLVPSMRLKSLRDGSADFEYLTMMRSLGLDTSAVSDALQLNPLLDPDNPFRNMQRDPQKYMQTRLTMAHQIVAALGRLHWDCE